VECPALLSFEGLELRPLAVENRDRDPNGGAENPVPLAGSLDLLLV